MKKEKCKICNKTKGKRLCKIQDNCYICSRCCVEIRGNDCHNCVYFIQSEKYAAEKHKKTGFKHFIARVDPYVDKQVDKALEILDKGNIAKAERLIRALLKEHPDLYGVQYAMGTVMAIKGEYATAIKYFDKALEIFPYFVEAWMNKATAHKHLLDIDGAIYALQKVIEFGDPKEEYVRKAKQHFKELETSIYKTSGLSVKDFMRSKEIFNNAFKEMQKGNYDKAISGFTKVVNMNPRSVQAWGNLAVSYGLIGKKAKALECIDKSLSIDPDYQPAIDNKRIISALKDGEKLSIEDNEIIDYYKEKVLKEQIFKDKKQE